MYATCCFLLSNLELIAYSTLKSVVCVLPHPSLQQSYWPRRPGTSLKPGCLCLNICKDKLDKRVKLFGDCCKWLMTSSLGPKAATPMILLSSNPPSMCSPNSQATHLITGQGWHTGWSISRRDYNIWLQTAQLIAPPLRLKRSHRKRKTPLQRT